MGDTYAASGVDLEAADSAVERIKPLVASTVRPEVLSQLGSFGGLVAMPDGYRQPVLVSGTDGVGTKSQIARLTGRYDTIGVDLVAMNADDIVAQGAQPLFFLDYISTGQVNPDVVEALVAGVAAGCRQAGCALVGGEISEHPGTMAPDEFDLVGFVVGVVERERIITGEAISAGDVLVGLPSPGLRSNGYSLARRVFFQTARRDLGEPAWDGAQVSLADELLRPSVIYTPAVLALADQVAVKGVAHITGGGIPGNLPRVLPASTDAVVREHAWRRPEIFAEIQRVGEVSTPEMRQVFNLGIGMVVVVGTEDAKLAVEHLQATGHDAVVIGEVVAGSGQVHYA